MPKKSAAENGKTDEIVKITFAEYEKKVLELAKSGLTSEKIGIELKKQNIHANDFPIKISKILKDHDLYVSPDLKNAEKKLERIGNHYKKNKQDKKSMREKDRIFAQVRKTKKYLGLSQK